ncbi:MAG: serine/threonine-protein kinase [Polyangiales bacterium]
MAVDVVQARPTLTNEPALPRKFGSYLLLERIGRGGMAEIFLAHASNALGAARRVVVKQMLPQYSADPVFGHALISEAKLAARLSHHNIVRVLDLGREGGHLYIAMEYVEGFDLNQLLGRLSRRQIPLPLEFAIFTAREVLAALDYAHRAVDGAGRPLGVVHRDVSPSNVLISLEGEIRLCDFGIARAFTTEAPSNDPIARAAQAVLATVCAGKAWYMSPEQARGQDVDARSDVFAAGVLLWELCAGRRMYKGADSNWADTARLGTIPPLPDRGFPSAERLQAILDRALQFDPALRFQSAQEMLDALETYALSTQLMASELRFGAFLSDHFGASFAERRRARDLAVRDVSTPTSEVAIVGPAAAPADTHPAPAVQAQPTRPAVSRAARESSAPPEPPEAAPAPGSPLSAAPEPTRQAPAAKPIGFERDLSQSLLVARRRLAVWSGSAAALVVLALVGYWLATH